MFEFIKRIALYGKINQEHSFLMGLALCMMLFFISSTLPVYAASIEQQRQDYRAAKKALHNKQYKTFTKITARLEDYSLYPYLRYRYLVKRLWKVKDEEIIHFLQHHSDLPSADYLRKSWLRLLAQRGHWRTFLTHYVTSADLTMQCYHLKARLKTNPDAAFLKDTLAIWLNGKSLPPQCDIAFKHLYNSELLTNELVWRRIRLAMQNNNTGLSNYLARRLDPEYKRLAKIWVNTHNRPDKHTRKPELKDDDIGREILVHGILRLARQNIAKAAQRFSVLQKNYSFSVGEVTKIKRALAIRAAKSKNALAVELLDQVDPYHVDDEILRYRLRVALKNEDWARLKKWTVGQTADDEIKMKQHYWHARAMEQTGEPERANKIFHQVAKERNYYGFMAADRLNLPYQMNYASTKVDEAALAHIRSLPGIQRAHEFLKLDETYNARSEWHHIGSTLTSYQLQLASVLASQWQWHDRTIFTLHRAKVYSDLDLRFPILFAAVFDKYAKKRNLDRSWIYALSRAESAFIEKVRSPAGALGLMQVMPRTGKQIAKRIGLKHFKPHKLKQARTNVMLGTAYMKEMLNKFGGNMMLATAAYNAGPHRVKQWLPKQDCLSADIWAELIPFNETRKYVRRVLTFTSIYDWRLGEEGKRIDERIAPVAHKYRRNGMSPNCTPAKKTSI